MDPDSKPSASAAERLRRDRADARVNRASGEGGRTARVPTPRTARNPKPRTARNPKPRTARTARTPRTTPLVATVTDGRGRPAAAPGLARWLAKIAPATAPRDVAIALVTDARIRALNKQFRRKDAETDVLSFEPSDIVIATGVARRQARESGHSYTDELKILALHGLLHLMGYDHHDPTDRGRMARVERRLRAAGGLDAGLIERSHQ